MAMRKREEMPNYAQNKETAFETAKSDSSAKSDDTEQDDLESLSDEVLDDDVLVTTPNTPGVNPLLWQPLRPHSAAGVLSLTEAASGLGATRSPLPGRRQRQRTFSTSAVIST